MRELHQIFHPTPPPKSCITLFLMYKWLNDLSSNDIIFKCVLNESSTVQFKFQLHPINPNQKHLISPLFFYLMVRCCFNH